MNEKETTTRRFVLLLPPAQWERLRSESERTGEPVNVIVRRLIREHFKAMENQK
jgi:predicted DNA-binding protein